MSIIFGQNRDTDRNKITHKAEERFYQLITGGEILLISTRRREIMSYEPQDLALNQ